MRKSAPKANVLSADYEWPDPETEYVQSPEFPSFQLIAKRWGLTARQVECRAEPKRGDWKQKRRKFWTCVREEEMAIRAKQFARIRTKVHPRLGGLAWKFLEALEVELGDETKKNKQRSLARLANAFGVAARELRIANALEMPPGQTGDAQGRSVAVPDVSGSLLGPEPPKPTNDPDSTK